MRTLHMRMFALLAAFALLAWTVSGAFASFVSADTTHVTTQAATGITSTDATLNALNGPEDATGSAFWVATSSFSVASSASPVLPDGVYSTGDLGAVASSTAFSAQLTAATIPSALTVEPETTYHYVAWVQIDGVWYPNDEVTFETSADISLPVISGLGVSDITADSATISFETDVAADSEIHYGTTTAYGSTQAGANATTSHSVTLTGLEENTTYHFQVSVENEAGVATSTDQTFMTLASSTATTTPLAIDDTEAVDTTGIANGEWEDGWEWVISFTVPEDETEFQMRFTDFSNDDDSFDAAGNIRYFSEQSSATTSDDAVVIEEENEFGDVITLSGDTDPGTPGRQVEVHVQVKIPLGTPEGEYSTTFQARTDTP